MTPEQFALAAVVWCLCMGAGWWLGAWIARRVG